MPDSTRTRLHRTELAWCCGIACWLMAAAGVWVWGAQYGFATYAPGKAFAHQSWPHESKLDLAASRSTLVVFLHPKCPCSRASIRELERLLNSPRLTPEQQPRVAVLVSHPANASAEWRVTDTVKQASQLPRATIVFDPSGRETARFGAAVSGTVMLYRPDGAREFAGGVTASRGHEGANAGIDALEALLSGSGGEPASLTPAFGCRLCVSDDASP